MIPNFKPCINDVLLAFEDDLMNHCIPASQYLGYLISKKYSNLKVYTAQANDLPKKCLVPMQRHQVTIINNGKEWLSLDSAISAYSGNHGECLNLSAGSKEELMDKLSGTYSGEWIINQDFDKKINKYLSRKDEQSIVKPGMVPFKVKWNYEGKNFEEGAFTIDAYLKQIKPKLKIKPKKLKQSNILSFA